MPGVGNFTDYLNGNFPNSFVFTPTNSNCVNSIIQSLKNKRSNVNVVPVTILKRISHIISPVLAKMINISIMAGKFPDSQKIARVVPIFKKGSRCLLYTSDAADE